ncbi:hypothetical protein AB6A40_000806 [Gnathostoma spinigerum]|uniref:Serine/threonine-protein phosphatase 4 regulatory subunit 1 n=1 Tax=Gnathostoma spinigerum TaxID=75299 RepID=A0ABD6E4X1_9BILA
MFKVVCVGYQRLGHFIATFADSSQTGLEVCNGRLVFIEKPISASSSCSFPNNDGLTECNEKLEVEDEFDALPPHAVLPKVEAHETTPRTSSPPIAEDPMLNELTGLLDSWTSDISRRTARNAHSSILDELNGPGGAAAYCSTHNDLSKLGVDDDDFMDEEVEEENGEDAQQLEKGSTKVSTSQQTDDDFNTLTYWSNEPLLGQSDELHYGSCGSKRSTVDVSVYFERSLCAVYKNSAVACNIESLEGKDHNDHLQPEDEITPVIDDETLMDDVPDSELERTFVVKRAARLAHLDDSDEEFGELSDDDTEDVIESNAVLEQNIVPQDLLDSYVHMLSPNSSEQIDISRHCAHSFPAVAFTLGRRNWYCLKGIYKKLASDMQWRVRQSLASSMHEVAAIIGSENTDQHLVPIFEQFMRDIEDVKVGLLKHLFEFFQLVTPSTRRKLLSVLANFLHSDTDNERNWRFRREFTRQCILLCDLYNVEDVNTYLAAIALTLANDRISDVRKEAATLLAHILGKFVAKEWHDDSSPCDELSMPVTGKFVADIVNGFCRSKNWQRRQTFTVFCERAFRLGDLTPKQFSLLLLNDLIRLSNDPVANVRLSFIRAISATQKDILFTQHDYSVSVRRSIQLLVEDADMDCRREARLALGMIDTENVIDVQKRGERLREQEEVLMMQWHTAENCDTSVISRS